MYVVHVVKSAPRATCAQKTGMDKYFIIHEQRLAPEPLGQ